MKKIINGKTYNTDTAQNLGSAEYSGSCTDFQWFQESLYRTKLGAFFIAGEGGPMSRYSQSCGQNSWTGGKDLTVISEGEAKDWMEQNCSAEDYEIAFGSAPEA